MAEIFIMNMQIILKRIENRFQCANLQTVRISGALFRPAIALNNTLLRL